MACSYRLHGQQPFTTSMQRLNLQRAAFLIDWAARAKRENGGRYKLRYTADQMHNLHVDQTSKFCFRFVSKSLTSYYALTLYHSKQLCNN